MCELFGFSSAIPENITPYLNEFFSHSLRHPHGWGLALEHEGHLQIEKEPVRASNSLYLRRLLLGQVETMTALAHIRYATVGNVAWKNCHPYSARDLSGRRWTLIHNGTIFDFPPMNPFYARTDSDTDSACLLSYLLDHLGRAERAQDAPLAPAQRFSLLDRLITELAPGNKVNLMLYDGELLYVHTNYRDTLYQHRTPGGVLFSTQPLSPEAWEPVPFTQLLAYRDGALAFSGTCHGSAYQEDPEQLRLLYLACAEL